MRLTATAVLLGAGLFGAMGAMAQARGSSIEPLRERAMQDT
jgi:hypothetical protein